MSLIRIYWSEKALHYLFSLINFTSLDFKRSITHPHRLSSGDKIESRLKHFIFGVKYL